VVLQDQVENEPTGTLRAATPYDIVICGSGLGGSALARQIKLQHPQWSVVLIEPMGRPLPAAGHKVGESTVELGAYYLAEKLQLADYLNEHQFPKLGLRYFFGNAQAAFADRPEMGLSAFPPIDSYQLDRGTLENDLRQFNAEAGVILLEGVKVQQIELKEGTAPHEVRVADRFGNNQQTFQARWVVDATGRQRFLHKQLGLTKEKPKEKASHFSAAWFRLPGRIDVDALVPATQTSWHQRVPQKLRYFSTNHLMGHGYWVWLIPLSTNYTSVGIVVDESLHPFSTFNTYERAMTWLQKYEPMLACYIAGSEPLDFKCMNHYSYSAKQVFSQQRWACVGDAAAFVDPFYSPGTNMIGFANSIVIEMMQLDFADQLTAELVEEYNRFFLGMNDSLTTNIQLAYPFYGHATVMTAKLLWDFTNTWAFSCPQMFNDTYLDPIVARQLRQTTARLFSLIQTMQRLWVEWAALSPGRLTYDFFDYLSLDFLSKLRLRNLQSNKTPAQLIADQEQNMQIIEQLAQVIFWLAVEDVLPEAWERFAAQLGGTFPWLNAWRIGLKPERWEVEGLLRPTTTPTDLSEIYQQLRHCFSVCEDKQPREKVLA